MKDDLIQLIHNAIISKNYYAHYFNPTKIYRVGRWMILFSSYITVQYAIISKNYYAVSIENSYYAKIFV